jgi:hypothetical protein
MQVNAFQRHEESRVGFVGFGDGVQVNEWRYGGNGHVSPFGKVLE